MSAPLAAHRAVNIPRLITLAALAACLALPAGCVPQRFVIDVAPSRRELAESAVLADAGAGRTTPKVALIHIGGLIADASLPGLLGSRPNPVDELVARLQRAENDPTVRAIVLRINSPGGTVAGSDTMYREIRGFAERSRKPVVASMGEVATSGGYYIALAGDHILAQPTSVTGSIGVIIQTVNFSDGLARIGVHTRALTSGPNKDIANPLAPMRDEQFAVLQGMVDDFYDRFRGLVVERREGLRPADVESATDGRIMTGAAAAEMGLVDETGGVRDAFNRAKQLANLESARLVTYHSDAAQPRTPYAAMSDAGPPRQDAPGGGGDVNMIQVNIPGLADGWHGGMGFYYLWVPSGG